MARSTPKLCNQCRRIVAGPCPTCSTGWNTRKPQSWADGGSRRWRKVRAAKLTANPLCEWPGCTSLAVTVDHLDGTNYATQRFDFEKLRSLCEPHHSARTAAQSLAARTAATGATATDQLTDDKG